MHEQAIRLPARELNEFEKLVYNYAHRTTWGSKKYWDIDARDCNLRFESANRGPPSKASFLLTITPALSNYMGNLHGGCAATLIDLFSGALLFGLSEPGKYAMGGVSRNLKLTYLRPVSTGMEVRVACEVIHIGRRLALLRAEIQKAGSGDVCVVGEHEMANIDPEVTQRI